MKRLVPAIVVLLLAMPAAAQRGEMNTTDIIEARPGFEPSERNTTDLTIDQANERLRSGAAAPEDKAASRTLTIEEANRRLRSQSQQQNGGQAPSGADLKRSLIIEAPPGFEVLERNSYRGVAERGDADAQYRLGEMYDEGYDGPQDYAEAAKWYSKAAEQGHASAQYRLGVMYANGQGVPGNSVKAAQWFHDAAKQGHARAQRLLGYRYYIGLGVPQDYALAHMWLNLAAARLPAHEMERAKAADLRDRVARKMSPAQIAEAQKRAREWMAQQGN